MRFVIVPVEVSVNVTTNATVPVVGVAVNDAVGGCAPVPMTMLEELPPLAVLNATRLVKLATVTGANCTVTFVEPPAGNVNGLPETIEYGPPVAAAVPLVTVLPPVLVTVNTRCELEPVATVPKFNVLGVTTICPGNTPMPLRPLVETPPLLLNTTFVVNVPGVTGMKLTVTVPVWPPPIVNGLPPATLNGPAVVAAPVNVRSPALITENVSVLVWPMITEPKSRPVGLIINWAGLWAAM